MPSLCHILIKNQSNSQLFTFLCWLWLISCKSMKVSLNSILSVMKYFAGLYAPGDSWVPFSSRTLIRIIYVFRLLPAPLPYLSLWRPHQVTVLGQLPYSAPKVIEVVIIGEPLPRHHPPQVHLRISREIKILSN